MLRGREDNNIVKEHWFLLPFLHCIRVHYLPIYVLGNIFYGFCLHFNYITYFIRVIIMIFKQPSPFVDVCNNDKLQYKQ